MTVRILYMSVRASILGTRMHGDSIHRLESSVELRGGACCVQDIFINKAVSFLEQLVFDNCRFFYIFENWSLKLVIWKKILIKKNRLLSNMHDIKCFKTWNKNRKSVSYRLIFVTACIKIQFRLKIAVRCTSTRYYYYDMGRQVFKF